MLPFARHCFRFPAVCLLLIALLSTATGCLNGVTSSDPPLADPQTFLRPADRTGKIQIVATVGMVADLVRAVGGSHVSVKQLMGPGVDPHLYKANRDDVRDLMRSEMVFYSGLMLEGKMTDALRNAGRRKPSCQVTAALDPQLISFEGTDEHHPDPHVWMDVSLWSRCVDEVVRSLSEFDPSHATDYRNNAADYQSQLSALHAYGLQVIGSIPTERRVLITSHDAFHYFGRAYGLRVLGVQGISTDSEAGLQQINSLVDLLVEQKIPAVFVESSVPRKSIETLIRGAAAHDHTIRIGAELYSDAMGPTGTYEGTYLGMLDHNLTRVARSLGGTAPERGSLGKLSLTSGASD